MTDGRIFFYCTLQKYTIKQNTPPSPPYSSRSLLDFLRHYTHPPLVFLDLFYFASFLLSMILYFFFLLLHLIPKCWCFDFVPCYEMFFNIFKKIRFLMKTFIKMVKSTAKESALIFNVVHTNIFIFQRLQNLFGNNYLSHIPPLPIFYYLSSQMVLLICI